MDDKLKKLLEDFARKLAEDMNDSLRQSLGARPNPPSITMEDRITFSPEGAKVEIIASEDYWYYIENGRKKGKMPPSKVFGKEWQNKLGIDARKVLLDMSIKTRKSGLKKTKKALNYDKSVKSLAFVIARSIGKKGIKPKPFIDRVTKDGRIEQLTKDIADLIGKQIVIDLK